MTEQLDNQNNQWAPCPSGEISGLVTKIHRRRRTTSLLEFGGGTVLGILIAVVAFQFLNVGPTKDQFRFGGITCAEVKAKATQYFNNQLDPVDQLKVERHLAECPQCGPFFKRMKELQSSALETQRPQAILVRAAAHHQACNHDCPHCRQRRLTDLLYVAR